jgi:hypothetical protein
MKKKFGSFLAPMVSLALVLGNGAARAALTINNPSFETPSTISDGSAQSGTSGTSGAPDTTTIPSWSAYTTGNGGGNFGGYGILNPNSVQMNQGTVAGNNVAYIHSSFNGGPNPIPTAIIFQDIGNISQSGSYTLSLLVGNRLDLTTGQPIITLLQGSSFSTATTITATGTGSNPALANDAGNMVQWSFNYTIPSGTEIWVELSTSGFNNDVVFDNLQITAVPEPVNVALALFGIIAVGGIAGRRWLASRKNALQPVSAGS